MIVGSCLCGAVGFEIDYDGIAVSVACYCDNCRKVSGGPYGVYLQVRQRNFRWLAGEDQVATYESSPGNPRGFCRTRGCVAPTLTNYGAVRVPGGALDDDPGRAPDVILYDGGAVAWCVVDDVRERFVETGPPEFWRRMIAQLHG